MRRQLVGLVAVIMLVISGCSGTPSDGNNEPNSDAGGEDTDVFEDADAGEDADADACVPDTACREDQCGVVDDGCGGTLECEVECPCQEGDAVEGGCGACGLGQRLCGANETGFGTCVAPEVPGLEDSSADTTCSDALVFVDKAYSGGDSDGSRESPFRALEAGLTAAEAGDSVIVAGETAYAKAGGFELKEGVHLLGGFSGAPEFRYVEDMRATITGDARAAENVFGLKGEAIEQKTIVAGWRIETKDAVTGAAATPPSNYGVYLRDADGVELKDVTIVAGQGGDGTPGENGEPGAPANVEPDEPRLNARDAASGGFNSACPSANGGDGGKGGAKEYSSVQNATFTVDPTGGAEPATAWAGGTPGEAGTSGDKDGGDGANGVPGDSGRDGEGGATGGTVEQGLWAPTNNAEDGEQGVPGIGGAGGGGSWHGPRCDSGVNTWFRGSNGGAGGAGGCGGEAGTAGGPGGGSFGLFLVNSNPHIADASVTAGLGGVGGRGGDGGAGAEGQPGTDGGQAAGLGFGEDDHLCAQDTIVLGWSAGDGGDGGSGGDGGDGGGGAGGVSYGIFCENSAYSSTGDVEFRSGGNAFGGDGGRDGRSGERGDAAPQKGCE